ncbi:restriction endonuclease [Actinoallomurus rhizosphaericola]|uniref:restriction endonuclease n=1 Tax=Actinoallomurus rhizosphaericola TaxID=2952536 RepID=UPI002093D2DE|nr:restriction endonuclease [Actinoallomurus rhizosphaericola]MCO5999829.1 restriction endonuclease [Actinoallomurus rhizosphaericola]
MPRAGRSLELLVKALEQLLAGAPVEIRSPDYIKGRHSGTAREVDVSLRSRVGSISVLVIIECRDRTKPQDVTWIEQLASKREDVGADKAVAVSASGFSASARNLAKSKQIDLRSLEELEPHVVFDWLTDQTIDHRTRYINAVRISVHLGEPTTKIDPTTLTSILEKISALRISDEGINQDSKIFAHKTSFTLVSVDDILDLMPHFGARFDTMLSDVPPGEEKRILLTIDFEGDARFALPVDTGLVDVDSIQLDALFSYDENQVPIRRYLYQADSGTMMENAEATITSNECRVTVGFHMTPDGSTLGVTVDSAGKTLPRGMDLTFDLPSPS